MKSRVVKALLALAVAVLAALAAACTSGPPPSATPPSVRAEDLVRGAPAITFDKLQVDLGTVPQDQQGVETFLVVNRGEKPLQISSVDVETQQGCEGASTATRDLKIDSGKVAVLPIKLGQHQELGPHRLAVHVQSDDPTRPVADLSMRFTVVAGATSQERGPRLRVDKETIDVGVVPYDWPMYEQFTLRNDGDAPLVLEGVPLVRVEQGC
ncbi:MAG: DUF1573 domain-containing protein [Chloroflexi bacterium]|nr:DUF1573 domain-containing protein [Chloroflexota bacterium]